MTALAFVEQERRDVTAKADRRRLGGAEQRAGETDQE
jgi:hypothetical protein